MDYIAAHGSWRTFDDQPISLFLSRAKAVEQNKQKGYRFEFGLMAGDLPVYYDQGVPLAVEVINGQVTYYQRNLIQYDLPEVHDISVQTNAANIIASNYNAIYRLIHPEAVNMPPKETWFDEVVFGITDLRLGYYRSVSSFNEKEIQTMVPAWIITVNNNLRVFFDINSGQMLGSRTLS